MLDFKNELLRVASLNEATKNLITEDSAPVFEALCSHMLEKNKVLNLTAIRDEEGVILKHFVDSVAVLPFINGTSLADIGCGGGFPSLPIAILRPDISVLSVDSVSKKVAYVEDTAKHLSLSNVKTSSRRAEDLGKSELREAFDTVTARAVGRLNLLCELCIPLTRVGGVFLAMKSQTTSEELDEAKSAISLLGGKVEKIVSYTITNGSEELSRTIVVIRKIKKTPDKYPRNNSQISKKPL